VPLTGPLAGIWPAFRRVEIPADHDSVRSQLGEMDTVKSGHFNLPMSKETQLRRTSSDYKLPPNTGLFSGGTTKYRNIVMKEGANWGNDYLVLSAVLSGVAAEGSTGWGV